MRLRLCKYFAVRKRAIEPQRLRRTRNAYESKYIVPVCPCPQLIPICRCLLRRRRLKHLVAQRACRICANLGKRVEMSNIVMKGVKLGTSVSERSKDSARSLPTLPVRHYCNTYFQLTHVSDMSVGSDFQAAWRPQVYRAQ